MRSPPPPHSPTTPQRARSLWATWWICWRSTARCTRGRPFAQLSTVDLALPVNARLLEDLSKNTKVTLDTAKRTITYKVCPSHRAALSPRCVCANPRYPSSAVVTDGLPCRCLRCPTADSARCAQPLGHSAEGAAAPVRAERRAAAGRLPRRAGRHPPPRCRPARYSTSPSSSSSSVSTQPPRPHSPSAFSNASPAPSAPAVSTASLRKDAYSMLFPRHRQWEVAMDPALVQCVARCGRAVQPRGPRRRAAERGANERAADEGRAPRQERAGEARDQKTQEGERSGQAQALPPAPHQHAPAAAGRLPMAQTDERRSGSARNSASACSGQEMITGYIAAYLHSAAESVWSRSMLHRVAKAFSGANP